MARAVFIHFGHPALLVTESAIIALFHALDAWPAYRLPEGELSIALLDDSALANLHRAFLDDPSPTDVITFPGDPEDELAGEICVSVDRAVEMSVQHDQPFNRELTLYLVHGWLHLAGLDDRHDKDRQIMRQAEENAIAWLEQQNAVPPFALSN